MALWLTELGAVVIRWSHRARQTCLTLLGQEPERKPQFEALREQIRELVTEYHAADFPCHEFATGKSAVPVSGKVFNA